MVDVARRAGVSQKTVSRVVNNAPHVRPDVRDKVNQAIEELGYRPNVAARALASQRTHTIGVLAWGPAARTGPPALPGACGAPARVHVGRHLSAGPLRAHVAQGIKGLLARGVEGLVIEVPTHLVEVDALQLGGRPVVTSAGPIAGIDNQTVRRRRPGEDLPAADRVPAEPRSRDGLARRRAARLGRGRGSARRLAVSPRGGGSPRAPGAGRRLVGPVGLRARADPGRTSEVTAVFAANDHMAMGLLRAFGEAGRHIPRDVSVAGYDDVPEAEFQMVPLTTVAIDADPAAERILSELVHMIELGRPTTDSVDLEARLVIRRSTGRRPDR